jgi:hypothetical protein
MSVHSSLKPKGEARRTTRSGNLDKLMKARVRKHRNRAKYPPGERQYLSDAEIKALAANARMTWSPPKPVRRSNWTIW